MRGDYARVTAADRPGVAQPVPVRPVPAQPWGRIMLAAVLILALLVGGWEAYWRAYGVKDVYKRQPRTRSISTSAPSARQSCFAWPIHAG